MAFDFSLTVDLLKHRLLTAYRIIRGLPSDYFIEKRKSELINCPLEQRDFSVLPSVCHICGFSMAELILDNDWSIRACSAEGFKGIFDNPHLNQWQKIIRET